MRVERFVLDKTAFREQILKGDATSAMLSRITGSGSVTGEGPTRANARVFGDSASVLDGSLLARTNAWRT